MRLYKQFSLLMRDVSTLDSKGRNNAGSAECSNVWVDETHRGCPDRQTERVPCAAEIVQHPSYKLGSGTSIHCTKRTSSLNLNCPIRDSIINVAVDHVVELTRVLNDHWSISLIFNRSHFIIRR